MNQRFAGKGGLRPHKYRDVCYHRYLEMGGALSYWLRAEGPHLTKGLGKFSLICFYKKVFATHQQNILEFLFLFEHPFLYLLFFKNRRENVYPKVFIQRFSSKGFHPKVLIKGANLWVKGLRPSFLGNSLFFVFIKRFLQPINKRF
jgi:hypothetical protein